MEESPETLKQKIRSFLEIAPDEMKGPLGYVLQLTPVRSDQQIIPGLEMDALYDNVPLRDGEGKVAIYTNTGYGQGWVGVCTGRRVSFSEWECRCFVYDDCYKYCLSTRLSVSARKSSNITALDMVAAYMAVRMVPPLRGAMEELKSTEATVREETKKPSLFKVLRPSTLKFMMDTLKAATGYQERQRAVGWGLVASMLLKSNSREWRVAYIGDDCRTIKMTGNAEEVLWMVLREYSVSVALQGEETIEMAALLSLRKPFFAVVGTFVVPDNNSFSLKRENIIQACEFFGQIVEELSPSWSDTKVNASSLPAGSPSS